MDGNYIDNLYDYVPSGLWPFRLNNKLLLARKTGLFVELGAC